MIQLYSAHADEALPSLTFALGMLFESLVSCTGHSSKGTAPRVTAGPCHHGFMVLRAAETALPTASLWPCSFPSRFFVGYVGITA